MMNNWDLILLNFPWMGSVLVALLGLCVGSFLNVCIYRMPRGLSVVSPRSFCPKSNTPLKWFENIPVLSFIFLRGRGRKSGEPIGWQYPAVEILTAVMWVALWQSFPPAVAACYILMATMFLAGSFIDWQFKIIPDSLTVGGMFLGLIASICVPELQGIATSYGNWELIPAIKSLGISLQGALLGSAMVLWMAILGEMALKKEAMGFGDVKLMGMIGAFLGWEGAVFSLFGGAIIGSVVAVIVIVAEKISGKPGKFFGREIPFGPMLCAAALVFMCTKGAVLAHWSSFLRTING